MLVAQLLRMKLVRGWVGWGLVWTGATLVFVNCSGSSSRMPSSSDGGGTAGSADHAGEGGTSPVLPVAVGGAGGDGETGGGGEGGSPESLEPTFPLTHADVLRIAGTSFTTPRDRGAFCSPDTIGAPPRPSLGSLQLAFVANDSEGVDVIASTYGPWLSIQRSQLLRSQSGYVVDVPAPTIGCLAYEFEDGYRPEWVAPARLALDFADEDEKGRFTTMSVSGRFDDEGGSETLTATGVRDVEVPSILERKTWVYEPSDQLYYRQQVPLWSLPRRFDFTEALRPGWSVALENDAGDHFEVARSNGRELAAGFDVLQFFPPGFHWVVTGSDLAGNALTNPGVYPSSLPPIDSGTFDAGDAWPACGADIPPDLENCVAAVATPHDDVPALAGDRSLLISEPTVALRIARVSGASKLLFQARLLGGDEHPSLKSFIQALDAGSSASASQQVTAWTVDHERSTQQAPVSLAQEVSLQLPPGSGDVMLNLSSSSVIWLDSVRTE